MTYCQDWAEGSADQVLALEAHGAESKSQNPRKGPGPDALILATVPLTGGFVQPV